VHRPPDHGRRRRLPPVAALLLQSRHCAGSVAFQTKRKGGGGRFWKIQPLLHRNKHSSLSVNDSQTPQNQYGSVGTDLFRRIGSNRVAGRLEVIDNFLGLVEGFLIRWPRQRPPDRGRDQMWQTHGSVPAPPENTNNIAEYLGLNALLDHIIQAGLGGSSYCGAVGRLPGDLSVS
jgi:hypothetical protein